MINTILKIFNYKVVYICSWGIYESRYSTIDYWAQRPIHPDVSVAPPWAAFKLIKLNIKD